MNVIELTKQDDFTEPAIVRQQAGHQGWRIDDDGWFLRKCRPGDAPIGTLGFEAETDVYVSSCEDAIKFDRICGALP